MSVIEKMFIKGIRSFSPDDQNNQVIEFFIPLTLISGPNGSGKTTIIECLRYITTGDTPPNSDRGGSFVHDPKIAGESEVKGQVKLLMKDVLGNKVTATRNMVATQKQKKIQLKTLDGIIERVNASGEKITLTSKGAEMDKEMITALGVSKAILNHVIFCHQEESNWPLSEGKALKQKFDEIFAATRYIKALEEIRKNRLAKMSDIKLFKAQAENLKENRRKANEFAENLDKTKSRFAACKDSILDLTTKLRPVTDKLQEISIKEHDIGRLQSDLESNNKLMGKLEKDENDMKSSIGNLFEGSEDELQCEMKNFGAVIKKKEKRLELAKQKCIDLESDQKNLQKMRSKMQEEFGKLKAEHKLHEDRIATRDAKLSELSQQVGLGEVSLEIEETLRESQIQNVLRNWKQKLAKTQRELETTKEKFEMEENSLQQQIDKVRDQKSQKEQKQKTCIETIAKNKDTLHTIDTELSQVDSLANRQDDIKEDLAEAEAELTSFGKSIDVNSLRSDITKFQNRRKELELKLTGLNQEMNQLQKESKVRNEIDLLTKDKTTKQEGVDKTLQRHKETVIHLIGNMPERNVQDSIKSMLMGLNREVQDMTKDLENKRCELSSLQVTKKFDHQELKKKEELLTSYRNKLFNVCGSENFDEGLDVLEQNVKELQDEKGSLSGSLCLYNKYIEKLSTPKPCCPLCTRSFERNQEAEQLKQDLQRKLQLVPSQISKKEKHIAEQQKRLNSMLELRPLKLEIINISEKEIPELKRKVDKVDEDHSKIANEISDLEEILESKQCNSKTGTEMLPDLAILDQSQRDIQRLGRRLSILTCQLGSSDISRTLVQVGEEQSAVQNELDSVRHSIESTQSRISDHNEQVQQFRERINDLRAEQVEISGRLQKKNALEEQLASLASENTKFTELVKEIKVQLMALEKKIKEFMSEKKCLIKQHEQELETMRNKINLEEKEMEYVDSLTQDIDRYVNGGKEKELFNHENKISSVDSKIQEKVKELSKLNQEKEELNEMITSQQIKYREYDDNMKLMHICKEIQSLKSKCRKLQEKIGDFDIRTFLSEQRCLIEQEKQLTKERNEHEGRQTELVKQVALLESQLQDKVYKDAEKKHSDMSIQLRTTELLCDDLNKYYIAFDKAVMSFHKSKMDEINKILRDLWIKTYTGNDIDYIEIRSNEDDSESGLEKAKRVYNYKVITMTGETACDMRGKCSAGQKVLASLLIRLALAETFCLNCGILALDEPTTNLDRENMSSLAMALVEIVRSRSEQSNFQLIIITHDDDFIRMLGRSETVDYFYNVYKDVNTCSRLEKCLLSSTS